MSELFGMMVFVLGMGLAVMALTMFAVVIAEGLFSLWRGKDNGNKGA